MRNCINQLFISICLFCTLSVNAQSVQDEFKNSGIWQDYGIPVSAKAYPEFDGRLVNCNWADIEVAPNVWDWTIFDQDIKDHIADSMPIIFLVYTRMGAPDWIFSNGVPKVNETNSSGISVGYSPYYLDADYNFYFKRMITQVRQHVQSMDPSIRNKIIGVQACFGNTGDQIAYKGDVPKQYEISDNQFDSLFKVYSLYYYNEYKDLLPKITMLSNPNNEKPDQQYWLNDNCPGGWTKCGTLAKGSQQNSELDKQSWLYDLLNKPWNGKYIKARSEIVGSQMYSGWWTKNEYKEMFGIMCYCIYWGVDWPNETYGNIEDPGFDSAFNFFNKYAGQKVPGLAEHAVCALKDALDASDSVRFPASMYGTVLQSNQTRFNNIYKAYSNHGALLEDVAAVQGSEYQGLSAKGTNDVGWRLLPGNYERYLHQVDANETSAGYWNVDGVHPNVMYGRYARGFDVANGKNALYFDVEKAFLRNKALNGEYPVTIDVTYYDDGNGSWKLYYDATDSTEKASSNITCKNTKTWKKATFILSDARFANKATKRSDFYIKNTGSSNVIFSVIELSRTLPPTAGFITTSITRFDTVCQHSVTEAKSFVLTGMSLDGSTVKVGPLKGFCFSKTKDGTYSTVLNFNHYGTSLSYTIYVRMKTDSEGVFTEKKIPIQGGGVPTIHVAASGTVLNSSPLLNANVVTISCDNRKDGSIDLQPQGGLGPFTYSWTNDAQGQGHWNDTDQDINNLNVGNYTVVVNSIVGCSVSKTFSITEPDVLVTSVLQDSSIVCKGGTTTVQVSALGGTKPYAGTGTFVVPGGFKTYTVTDAKGCVDPQGYTVPQGTQAAASKPAGINGASPVTSQQKDLVYSVLNPVNDIKYIWTVPSDAKIVTGQNTSSITVAWGSTTGSVTVQAVNNCGASTVLSKNVRVASGLSSMDILSAQSNTMSTEILLAPNPVKNVTTLRFTADKSRAYSINITDVSGKSLFKKEGISVPGINTERLNAESFAAGTYLVTITNDNGEKHTIRMVKQ